jgi:hypothetical protein
VQLDPFRVGVFGDVRQGFLGNPVERKASLGTELVRFARNGELARDFAVLLEIRRQPRQPFGSGQLVVAQRPDRPAGFVQAGSTQLVARLMA